MIPSTEQVAANIKRTCDGLADEIARRVVQEIGLSPTSADTVRKHAIAVLLDWLLGDFLPSSGTKKR